MDRNLERWNNMEDIFYTYLYHPGNTFLFLFGLAGLPSNSWSGSKHTYHSTQRSQICPVFCGWYVHCGCLIKSQDNFGLKGNPQKTSTTYLAGTTMIFTNKTNSALEALSLKYGACLRRNPSVSRKFDQCYVAIWSDPPSWILSRDIHHLVRTHPNPLSIAWWWNPYKVVQYGQKSPIQLTLRSHTLHHSNQNPT